MSVSESLRLNSAGNLELRFSDYLSALKRIIKAALRTAEWLYLADAALKSNNQTT